MPIAISFWPNKMLTQEDIRKNLEKQKVIKDKVDIARSRVAKDFFQVNELELKLGEPLPKYWHWFFCWETAEDKLLGLDGHIKPGNNIIPDTGFPRRMWGGSEINFFEPLLIGMKITRVITLESINYKKGNSGDFCVIEIKNELKKEILSNSIFAVCKSGTISLQVCNANVPSIIIYKLNFINFMIFKLLVNVKFANIINIINNKEVIPELLQSECNAKEIYNSVLYMLKNPEIGKKQLEQCNQTLKGIRSNSSSSNEVATILRNSLVG